MIGIVDYTLGNVKAFGNVYTELGIPCKLLKHPEDFREVSGIILPGVGAFDEAMRRLEDSGMRAPLEDAVLGRNVPVLGVCVGMQMLARRSEEGTAPGLGWIPAEVVRFRPPASGSMQIPHMGWNAVTPAVAAGLFDSLESESRFYFLHSYYMECQRDDLVLARAFYGRPFTCSVWYRNIYGVQFHPEKSHRAGTQLLKNFSRLV